MFWLKKLIGAAIMPLPVALALLSLGILTLLILPRRRLIGRVAILAGWMVLLIASNRGVSLSLTSSLERAHAPAPAFGGAEVPAPWNEINWVAVLGGGHGSAPELPAGQRLSSSARARLIEGVRIAHALPGTRLIVSGPADPVRPEEPTHARLLADAAVEIGFPRERIVEIDTARDTAEEATALAGLVGPERVALVTSAWHLPRALALTDRAGVTSLPCPADYLSRDGQTDSLAWFTWNAESLADTTRAWREYVGRGWAGLVALIGGG